ncbi:outer membrane beta-barrel protein [Chryseobacterium lathyri]|uniref:Opacity protein-like surface antigen n=1 Tax=Chryseobacterium lathyri TaxID=395933 RepID=A0ABT9SHT1_9FLAO|nr:outer membrane beta-barrel protein [Chryseobacterium lathyri]MDP9958982.1 opacity protein-like surface antigen [Chryseobacterium lathyri]MDQ0067031.1 opacity protein-like surface antigen [Chryseobacterium lathyri]
MKKVLSIALIGFSMFASAQISLAGKANLIFPTGSPSWKNIKGTVNEAIEGTGKNNAGFNVGLSLKIGLPTALYVMPELYYTHFKNEFTTENTTFDVKSNRIDMPVLLGYNLLGDMLGVFVGPVASYNLSKDDTYNDFKENVKNDFTVGYQFGAQLEIKKLIINARYEGAFSKDERNFINKVSGSEIRYDNRPNLFLVGVGYKFK